MTLPAHENTWVFDVNARESIVEGVTDELAARELILHYKQALCGHERHGHGGTFTFANPTVELTVTSLGGFPAKNFTSGLVGQTIEIVGATTGANNGYFPISAVTADNVIQFTNVSGVAEAFSGSYRILNTKWTALPNGRGPWKCKGSGAGTTGKGTGMDGIDRWATSSDLQSSTSASGDRSWFVFQNELSGAELCVFHYNQSSSSDFEQMEWVLSPIAGFTGGATNARPTAADEVVINLFSAFWLGDTSAANDQWNFYILHTDDGMQTMMWMTGHGVEENFFFSRLPSDVVSDALIPWNGTRNIMGFTSPTGLSAMTIAQWNDAANCWATIDKDASAGGLYKSSFRLSTAMMSNMTVAETLANHPNHVNGEWHAWSIRLECTTTGVRGSHGRLTDLFFAGDNYEAGMPMGAGMPADASRIYTRVGDFIVPWNGEHYRR